MEELKETVQKGHTLLRKKEERLSQLENSLLEEVHTHTHTLHPAMRHLWKYFHLVAWN